MNKRLLVYSNEVTFFLHDLFFISRGFLGSIFLQVHIYGAIEKECRDDKKIIT